MGGGGGGSSDERDSMQGGADRKEEGARGEGSAVPRDCVMCTPTLQPQGNSSEI